MCIADGRDKKHRLSLFTILHSPTLVVSNVAAFPMLDLARISASQGIWRPSPSAVRELH